MIKEIYEHEIKPFIELFGEIELGSAFKVTQQSHID